LGYCTRTVYNAWWTSAESSGQLSGFASKRTAILSPDCRRSQIFTFQDSTDERNTKIVGLSWPQYEQRLALMDERRILKPNNLINTGFHLRR
jgi:hypothetical protein